MGLQAAEQPGAFWQFGKATAIVVFEPAVEGALFDVLHGIEHADGDQFTDGQDGLGVLRNSRQGVVYLAVQFGDKIGNVDEVPPLRSVSTHSIMEPRGIFKIHSN